MSLSHLPRSALAAALGCWLAAAPALALGFAPCAAHAASGGMAPAKGAPGTAAAVPPAARLRVAFVDTARILRDSDLAKAASQRLQQTFEPRRRKLAELGQRIDALRNKLLDGNAQMSDDQRLAAQQQLQDLGREFRDDQQAFAEDLNAQRNADVSRILAKANQVVDQVATRMGCDIVFQNAVYVNPRIDITNAVIRQLDSQPPSH